MVAAQRRDLRVGEQGVPRVGGDSEGGRGPGLVEGDLGGEKWRVGAVECLQMCALVGDGDGRREADPGSRGVYRRDECASAAWVMDEAGADFWRVSVLMMVLPFKWV